MESLIENVDLQLKLIQSLLLILAAVLLRPLLMAIVGRRTEDPAVLYRWRKVAEYGALVIVVVGLSSIWLASAASLLTYLGLLSAGLAIALQDPITNLVGWLFIIWRRPFEVGDRVQVGERAGDVIDIRFFQFTLVEIGNWVDADQSTGRLLHVPNRKVFSESVANYNKGFPYIWHEIAVLVTFESNWRKAKKLLEAVVQAHPAPTKEEIEKAMQKAARRHLIVYENVTPIVYTRVVESGVRLTLRYLTPPRRRRGSEEAIWEAILDAFAEEDDIELAYPTRRYYVRPEDKGGTPLSP